MNHTPSFLLPPEAYRDQAWFLDEQRRLFGRTWSLVGAIEELDHPGAYVTTVAGGAPLVVVCGEDGELAAFHNICRHRGMVLLEGRGTVDAISCFYHEWRYALDGSLKLVPQRKEQFPDIDTCTLGLLPASVGVWEGMVFVHPHPDAAPFADALDELPRRIGSFHPGLLPVVAQADLTARCNWKLFVENHIDVYHLWYLHSRSLADLDHTRFEHAQVGRNWVSYEPLREPDLASARLVRGTRPIDHIDERDRLGVGAHMIFPNILMASNAEFFMTYAVMPVAPDESRIEVRMRAEPGAPADALLEAARTFIDEDILACERIQEALRSPWFEVGPLARQHEAPITAFHEHLLAAMR